MEIKDNGAQRATRQGREGAKEGLCLSVRLLREGLRWSSQGKRILEMLDRPQKFPPNAW